MRARRRRLRSWSTAADLVPSLAGLATLLLLAGSGCDGGPDEMCDPACAPTFRCDTEAGECRAKTASDLELEPPGRGLASVSVGRQTFLSSVHPEKGYIFAGRADSPDDMKAVGRIDEAGRARTAIAGTDQEGIAVVWRGDNGVFRLARRRDGRWQPATSVELEDEYNPTEDFDLAVARDGTVHILFRSSSSLGLRHLTSDSDDGWSLETVDDGSAVPSRLSCPPGGADPRRPGVGYDPDAEIFRTGTGRELLVSYYDGNCGDLRLAQSSGATWEARLVATGAYTTADSVSRRPGNVGRFSSLAVGSDRQIAVAYQDLLRARLSFAGEDDGTFRAIPVDRGVALEDASRRRKQIVGAFADLAVDANGRPYIAYLNGSTTQLRLAYRAKTSDGDRRWFHRRVSNRPLTGFHARIAVDERRIRVFSERLVRQNGRYRSRLVTSSVPKP